MLLAEEALLAGVKAPLGGPKDGPRRSSGGVVNGAEWTTFSQQTVKAVVVNPRAPFSVHAEL